MTVQLEQRTGTTTLTLVPLQHACLRRVRNWTDSQVVHRAVMALFPDELPGEPTHRRATGGILYRHDTPARGPARLLLQHRTPMRLELDVDPDLPHADLQPLLLHLHNNRIVQFRVVLNAVRTQTKTRVRQAVTDPDDLVAWGLQRLAAAGLADVDLSDQPRTKLLQTGHGPLWTAQFDGGACVRDSGAVIETVQAGMGRAKAYGCGLLSLALTGG